MGDRTWAMALLTRDGFREAVLARDRHTCVMCPSPAADAHHIVERRLWPDGGYYIENGASLCEQHRLEAGTTVLTCEAIRAAAGIAAVALPAHFDRSERYDRWGNVYLPSGMRMRGQMFHDEPVQEILRRGGVLDQFAAYVKFPKILHLPWSEGVDERTDRVLSPARVEENFAGQEVVVTEKLDGENTTMYRDFMHARSIGGRSHPSRNWVKNLHARIAHEIPEGWRVCGENMYAAHSIHYVNLPSFFIVFAVYNGRNICIPWEETCECAQLLGLPVVPLLCRGTYDEARVRACHTGRSAYAGSGQEGYVMRRAGEISWSAHAGSFGKFVRKGHVQTSHGWMHRRIGLNKLGN